MERDPECHSIYWKGYLITHFTVLPPKMVLHLALSAGNAVLFFFCTTICCCWRRASDGAILCTAHWRGGHFTTCDPQKQHYVSIRNRPSGHFTTDSPERAPVAFYHVFIWLELNRTGNFKIIHLKIQPNLTFLTFTLSSWSKYTDVSSGGAIRGFLCRPDIIFFPSARCLRAAGK